MVLQKNFTYSRNPIFLTFQYEVVPGDLLDHVKPCVRSGQVNYNSENMSNQ
jgi:hypothetical protein